jgi:hypothetical protein
MKIEIRRTLLVAAVGAALTVSSTTLARAQYRLAADDGTTYFDPEPDAAPAPEPEAAPLQPGHSDPAYVFGQCGHAACCQYPEWYLQADVLWLKRKMDEKVIAHIDTSPESGFRIHRAVLKADDFDHDFEPGVRVTVGHWLDSCRAVEFTYFGLHDWDSSASSPVAANAPDPTTGEIDGDVHVLNLAGSRDFRDSVQVSGDYSSRLHNFELNMRRRVGHNATVLTGFRYINIDEEFDLVSIDQIPTNPDDIGRYSVDTDNHMFGLQVGADYFRPVGGRLSWGVYGKAGLLLNFAESNRNLVIDAGALEIDNDEDEVELASVVEAGLMARYRLGDRCALRAGSQVVSIGGVALAIDQAPEGFETDAVWYHGPSAGFEYAW